MNTASTQVPPGADFADLVIIGNGSAAAGVVSRLKALFRQGACPACRVLVLEADTEDQLAAQIPEFNARVTFPQESLLPDIDDLVVARYQRIAFYAPRTTVRKALPADRVVLVDVQRLIDGLEEDLPARISIRRHKQVYDARYVDTPDGRFVELGVQYPFGDEKVFERTDRILARAVIDCSGTASLMLDKMQGYRADSDVVCAVLGFKVLGARIPDPAEVSLGLDDAITHGAGAWAYPNQTLSPALAAHLDRWFRTTTNARVKELIQGKSVEDFAATIADVGISSISTYANAHHYRDNLERQAADLFHHLPAYEQMFYGASVIPGSAFYKPSPVLQPVRCMAGERYLLVGDAAGHATPYIGEGIRPGIEMGRVAAEIVASALADDDLSARRLRSRYEAAWWERYGRHDLWSDLFRHFSSTCFKDAQWDEFLTKLQGLSAGEFYSILKSEYEFPIVKKMFPTRLALHYVRYQARKVLNFLCRRLSLRQAASWIK